MNKAVRCALIVSLSVAAVMPWQHVDAPVADEPEVMDTPAMVLPDPAPSTFPLDPPKERVILCGEGEWMNEAGEAWLGGEGEWEDKPEDGCEPLPETPETEDTSDPIPSCNTGWVLQEDLSCCPEGQVTPCTDPEAGPPAPPVPPITEESPLWDCRTMGNLTCGVTIEGALYLVRFEDGLPVDVYPY